MGREPRNQRLAPLLKAFFLEHLPVHRGVSPNTVRAYRDGWRLLLHYGSANGLGSPDTWCVHHLDRRMVLDFLRHLETKRRVSVRTRNARLAAIHAFYHYLVGRCPQLETEARRILSIPTKRTQKPTLDYLEPDELRSVLMSLPLDSSKAHRDRALFVFAYNTGARAQEIAQARESRVVRGAAPYIRILGKGRKERDVPLWEGTLQLLDSYAEHHRVSPRSQAEADYLFLNQRGQRLSRYTVSRIITNCIMGAAEQIPSLRRKRLTGHSMRHTTAVHLLQAGAEMNTIRTWLGHASNASLQIYLGLDLKTKQRVLEHIITPELAELCLRGASKSASLLETLDKL